MAGFCIFASSNLGINSIHDLSTDLKTNARTSASCLASACCVARFWLWSPEKRTLSNFGIIYQIRPTGALTYLSQILGEVEKRLQNVHARQQRTPALLLCIWTRVGDRCFDERVAAFKVLHLSEQVFCRLQILRDVFVDFNFGLIVKKQPQE